MLAGYEVITSATLDRLLQRVHVLNFRGRAIVFATLRTNLNGRS